jgi:hypothetical protein
MSEEYQTTHDEPSNYLDGIHTPLDPGPAPDAEVFGSDHASIEQAADELKSTRAERGVVIERAFHDGQDLTRAAPGNRTVSAEFAADSLKALRADENALVQAEINAATAKAVDDLRDQTPEVATAEQPQPEPQPELQPEYAPPESNPELDRLLQALPVEGRAPFLDNYNQIIQQAQYQASAQYGEALQRAAAVEQRLHQGVQQAGQIAIAGLLVAFPELSGINDNAQLAGAIQMLQKTNPQRAEQLERHVSKVTQTINLAQQQAAQEQQRQHAVAQQQRQQQQEAWQRYSEAARYARGATSCGAKRNRGNGAGARHFEARAGGAMAKQSRDKAFGISGNDAGCGIV